MRYSLINLFSQNLEILAPDCDVIISKLVQKTQICISSTTDCKNIKIRNYNNFGSKIFFWRRNFWILKHRSSLWPYHSKTGTIRAEFISESRFLAPWNCRRFWSQIQQATLQRVTFKGTCFYRTPLVVHYKSSSILQ